jgi:hypothetical protein
MAHCGATSRMASLGFLLDYCDNILGRTSLACLWLFEGSNVIPRPSLKGASDLALALVGASTVPVLLLDKNLDVVAASASFCSAYQIDPSTMDRRPFAELGESLWSLLRTYADRCVFAFAWWVQPSVIAGMKI